MDKRKVDVVILGMATAGLNAYRATKKANASAVIVDKGPLGTTCARVGCMPSKLLISAADAYHHCYQAQELGFELMGDVAIHGEMVMKRVQQMRDEFVAGVLRNIEVIPEREKLIGSARFLDPHTVCIDDHAQVEGKIAGTNAARYPDVTSFKRKTPLAVVYTDPQIAIFGKRFKDFGERGPAFVGTIDYEIQDRSRILNVNRGLGHLYADTAGTLLGGELIGPRVEHMGHLLAWCAQQGLTVNEMLDMPFFHPSFEEGIKDALVELQNEIGLTG
ncbi:MAG: hypothetical protein JSV40_09150 [Deltaproteobacteria bacterium]|nr:MAG: hypothetical protein JSV40_09150 [Deltaproteobacteria bacterium]